MKRELYHELSSDGKISIREWFTGGQLPGGWVQSVCLTREELAMLAKKYPVKAGRKGKRDG